ncbi:manganese transport protein [Catalinimonas alkaloidigena]|uniref:Nramp family divalent metal transporter n=1 Tax=Catalinimonas alkaloidigena TaxID=1075417 RepID=UPI002406308D|nr:Nramp family divalent metal transporter [Catalinimonas alkaloidigena]MDF9796448.1 manganese transport protein [Catalinimonas alkaloidigena]
MDAYAQSQSYTLEPPRSFWKRLKHLGPSLILTANIVGSGELIMTTSLGAKAGFVTLWVVIISCLVKVTIQLEFGKHAISSGETTLTSFNKLPGPHWKQASWSIWTWLLIKTFQFIQYGGIIGGVALALNIAFPSIAVWIWAVVAGLATAILTAQGKYAFFEKFSIFLVASFSLYTLYCVFALQYTSYELSILKIAEGLEFQLPPETIGYALAVFGITGVGADEIISYPYWCLEKGYARYTGPNDHSPEWEKRAKGWIKVMYLDGLLSMCIYTITTAAFYALGAAILHEQGQVPEGYQMIATISQIYTEALGPAAMNIFLIGAVVTLFSTLFVASASGTRMFTDGLAQIGVLDFYNPEQRNRWFKILAWFIPIAWTMLFLLMNVPLFMIMAGAISLTLLLLLVVYAAIVFRYRRLDKALHPGIVYDIFLWISMLSILAVGVKSLLNVY